ncbi:2-oxo acid dehydrogenase subunit E2 [Microseira wollei]|uniref:Dihydrolipoyllysine-residue acyltransferase component of branched-chain alpha-ketoacid dehydrogenase complex n=1 Tax=Microseira wollei NIES-4236 TaxID=2530354 RepID=A0AAV3XIY2_9CYAN|nr:2-oxo acid dehydrogenase subunit E2 [Microseira wollei]GET41556.1 dihydrolipoyllysine-residue acyltransferase component of branched-chain alpha-ketoacid dehydrogenase complex [Microseira wollei NIES-4236]
MHQIDLIGSFEERQFPDFRHPTIDTLIWGSKRHHIPILLEIDVTAAREAIREQKKTGQSISFTGWIVKCIAIAVSEHKSIHALRKGKRRLVIFDDVDVTIIVERTVPGADETLPMPYIIRKANEKSVAVISSEIRTAKQSPVAVGEVQIGSTRAAWIAKISTMLPRFVRDWFFWQPLFRNPFLFKRMMGTVSVTALGMLGQGGMNWGIPIGIHPLIVAVGAIAKRPGIVHDQIVVREYVGLTVLFDHDVTDGAPVARFIKRLQELIATGYGLKQEQGVDISK